MIACPICGARTAVVETRLTGTSARRRRRCTAAACDGKVTTVEVVVSVTQGASALAEGNNVLVPVRQLKKLRKLVAALGGGEA